jgi:hypothetical protein
MISLLDDGQRTNIPRHSHSWCPLKVFARVVILPTAVIYKREQCDESEIGKFLRQGRQGERKKQVYSVAIQVVKITKTFSLLPLLPLLPKIKSKVKR